MKHHRLLKRNRVKKKEQESIYKHKGKRVIFERFFFFFFFFLFMFFAEVLLLLKSPCSIRAILFKTALSSNFVQNSGFYLGL